MRYFRRRPAFGAGVFSLWLVACGSSPVPASTPEVGGPSAPEGTPSPGPHYVGRVERSEQAVQFAWSGSGAVVHFEGTTIGVRLREDDNEYSVVLDGQLQPKLTTQPGQELYPLAEQLGPGEHQLQLYRRTEASFGPSQLLGFELSAEGSFLPVPEVSRRIELVGDSISTAYGNEGESPQCGFSAETQNHYASYGALSARELGAELSTIAWSGKGVVYNYDEDITDPMPALYDRTLPQQAASVWDFAQWTPNAVVINLGTNDFSTDGDPEQAQFAAEYLRLLETIRNNYPEAYILCTVGPLLNGADLVAARAGIEAAVQQFEEAGGLRVGVWNMDVPNENPGCDYHPGLETHRRMGEQLTALLREALDWQ